MLNLRCVHLVKRKRFKVTHSDFVLSFLALNRLSATMYGSNENITQVPSLQRAQ